MKVVCLITHLYKNKTGGIAHFNIWSRALCMKHYIKTNCTSKHFNIFLRVDDEESKVILHVIHRRRTTVHTVHLKRRTISCKGVLHFGVIVLQFRIHE